MYKFIKLRAWETEDRTEEEIERRWIDKRHWKEKNGKFKTGWGISRSWWRNSAGKDRVASSICPQIERGGCQATVFIVGRSPS